MGLWTAVDGVVLGLMLGILYVEEGGKQASNHSITHSTNQSRGHSVWQLCTASFQPKNEGLPHAPDVGLGGLDEHGLVVHVVLEALRGGGLRVPVVHHLVQQLVHQDEVLADRLLLLGGRRAVSAVE